MYDVDSVKHVDLSHFSSASPDLLQRIRYEVSSRLLRPATPITAISVKHLYNKTQIEVTAEMEADESMADLWGRVAAEDVEASYRKLASNWVYLPEILAGCLTYLYEWAMREHTPPGFFRVPKLPVEMRLYVELEHADILRMPGYYKVRHYYSSPDASGTGEMTSFRIYNVPAPGFPREARLNRVEKFEKQIEALCPSMEEEKWREIADTILADSFFLFR